MRVNSRYRGRISKATSLQMHVFEFQIWLTVIRFRYVTQHN